MKKVLQFIAIGSFMLFIISGVFAAEINEQEIKSVGSESIVFTNYTGPHKVINSIEEIKGIGESVAKSLAGRNHGITKDGKYTVLRAADDSPEGLNADILILSPTAGVDHINNLRRIISAYLVVTWGYSEKDADILATYITVYNAVYRGDLAYFQKKYKQVVVNHLRNDIVGLSTNYKDWPGKTQIVIPFGDSVDTSVISDKKVIDNMREEEDRSVDTRKGMVEIKEKEADKATEEAQQAQKEATVAKKEADEAKSIAKEEAVKSQQATKEAEEAKKIAEENPDDKEAQKVAEEKAEVAEKQAEVAEKAKEEAEEKAEVAQNLSEKATASQAEADKKRSEAQSERTEIAKDQQQNIEDAQKKASMNTTYGLQVTDKVEMLSKLVLVNREDGSVVKSSPVTVIRNRVVYPEGQSFIAIAGKALSLPTSNEAIKLVTLDKDAMTISSQCDEIVSPLSVLVEDSGYYYCVIQVENDPNWYVGKYSSDLKLQAKSAVTVLQQTPIMVSGDTVCVTDVNERLRILSVSDLTLISTKTPELDVDAK